jgi:hypothetical protein
VMDAGQAAEIGNPYHLLADSGSNLSQLVLHTSPRALQVRKRSGTASVNITVALAPTARPLLSFV